jgi:hypothetical protein
MNRLVAACLLAALLAACSDDQPAPAPTHEPAPSAVPEAQLQTERQRPPADVAPVVAAPAADVIRNGAAIPFTVCSQRSDWQKPTPDEMTQVFTDRRFGDGVAPDPLEYTNYLTPFYFPEPFGAAVNKYSNAFGGFWDNSGNLEQFCDRTQLRADYDRHGGLHGFTPIGYRTVEVRLQGSDLVVVVEAGFDGWQEVIFPYPVDGAALNSRSVITSRQVVDASGRLLYQELWPSTGVAWQQSLQYDASGRLQFVVIGGILPYGSAPITISPGQPPLRLFSASPAQAVGPGSLRVLDAAGREVARIDWQSGAAVWQPLGTLDPPAGTYTLRFDDARHDWYHFVLLAAGVPLPPGVR